ncbi:gliding motility protein RemB [Mucilaginibacter sp. JRF]|nr:gliding motility protein RemB [Mucilaginibacter sp. JRF]
MILAAAAALFCGNVANAQSVQLPYQYQFYQKFNADVYSTSNNIHTALKPLLIDSSLTARYDSLMNYGNDTTHKGWVYRKLFREHLFDVRKEDYTFYADYLPDLTIGREFKGRNTTWLNTRGFQIGGTIGTKFSFYTSGFENQARFADYYDAYVNRTGMISGQSYDRKFGREKTKDWSYVTAVISYTPIKQLNFTLGQDKNFIGDGYRSLLLSDFATNYPFFRTTVTLGPIQYMAMWAYMQDRQEPRFDTFGDNRRKWAAFHYIDWTISNRASLGFFNAYIAPEANKQGVHRSFDVNFINPVFFASSLGPSSQPGNSIAGFNGKYKFLNKHAIYGQFMFDRVQGNEGKAITTTGWQAGVRGADLFGVTNLNYLAEYNTAQPYAYSGAERLSGYTAFSEPLAHPFGANFRETLGILNYSVGRFDLQGKVIYAKYGLDATATDNNGKNILLAFNGDNIPGTSTGQGLSTTLKYAEGTVGFILNPRYNLKLEVGGIYRQLSNTVGTSNTTLLTIGLRSTFRNIYTDF